MKKVILSLALASIGFIANAQTNRVAATHSDLSNNKPTATGEGYVLDFKGTSDNNCVAGGGVQFDAAVANQSWSIGTDSLVIVVPTMTAYDDTRQRIRFYSGDCVANPIDLSASANKKMTIKLNSTDNGQMLVIFYSGLQSNYSSPGLDVFNINVGANTLTVNTLNLTGITDETNITHIGLFFRGPNGFGDFDFAGTVKIASITVGDGIVPTEGTTTSVQTEVNNSLVSVYPNPAKDQINIDLSSMNTTDAIVKIMNSNGMVVYEAPASSTNQTINTSAYNKGMYMVQVSSGNKISNKKIVLE